MKAGQAESGISPQDSACSAILELDWAYLHELKS